MGMAEISADRTTGAMSRYPPLRDGLDICRIFRRIPQCLPQFDDDLGEGIVAHHHAGPDRGEQRFAAHDLARPVRKADEHGHHFGLELHGLVRGREPVQRRLDRPVADLQLLLPR